MIQEKLTQLQQEFASDLNDCKDSKTLANLEVKYLGRKGPLQQLMVQLKDAPKEEKPLLGKAINEVKVSISSALEQHSEKLKGAELEARLAEETLDITLPGRRRYTGAEHLINQVLDRIVDLMVEMGFSVQYGPDIDTNYYNFEALNFPPEHPAMDMQDTFYIEPDVLLRTHTSNVQSRFMEANKPPIRIVAPGRVYRNETVSARSHVFFHQVEGLYVDEGVSFADLMATLETFFHKLFSKEVELKFRPSYFPFVEPGMEIDIRCYVCNGEGCPICKQTGWLEVAGAGMVHPEVLKNGGIDPQRYSGFAWGMGIERLVMTLYGIKDIRLFYENDMRFLRQFV